MTSVLIAERYRLVRPIGTGGMGRVWLARDEMLHRDVAIKEIIPPEGLTEAEREELRQRTLREARAAARLSHPNVVQIYDVVHTEERPWIVMEYVEARSLHQVIRAAGPLSPQRTAEIGLSMLAALTAAHAAGVLHRDVKPSNVLIATDGRVVLSDFGLATIEGGENAVTRPGLVLGSPQYIAPERARDGISSPEADLWSLGATLYAAVEGRSPYARSSAMATLIALATANPDPTDQAGPLKPVLNGLLRRNPRARLGPDEVERLLGRIAAGDTKVRTRRRPRPRPPREPLQTPHTPHTPEMPGTGSTPTTANVAVRGSSPSEAAAAAVLTDLEPATVRLGAGAPMRPGPARGRPGRLARSYPRLVGVVVLMVAVGSAVLYTASRSGDSPGGPAARHSASVAASSAPAPPGGRSSSGATSPFIGTPGDGTEPYVLPTDWGWYVDPAGFRDGVPNGWPYSRDGPLTTFRGPGERELGLAELPLMSDPIADAKAQERQRVAAGELPNYAQLKLAPILYFAGCAEWEYTYDRKDGIRMHVIERRFVTPSKHAYRIVWAAPDFDFTSYNNNWWIITASFHPAA